MTTKTTTERVVALLAANPTQELIAAARELGGDQVLTVSSGESLAAVARDGRLSAAVIGSLDDLGGTNSAVLRVLAVLHAAKVEPVLVGAGGEAYGASLLRGAAELVERDKKRRLERIRRGRARASDRGVPQGRRPVPVDTRTARELLCEGHAIRAVAVIFGVSARTLRRRLEEEGTTASATPGNSGPAA